MSDNLVRDQYDEWHRARHVEPAPGSDPEPTAPWHELAKKHLGDIGGLHVLEIGCGRGAFATYLVRSGAHVTAADFSPAAVELTKEALAGRGEALVADVQALPFPDESFDLVISLETLEHVPEPDRGLAELVRVTRLGGRLIVTTPNYLSIVGLYRVYLRLVGRKFSEAGQPVNQPLMLLSRVRKLRRLGCRVDAVDGAVHLLPIPRYRAIHLSFLERPHAITKWFALHGLTSATRVRRARSAEL